MSRTVVLAGSGVSVDKPADIPSWWGYNNALINEIKQQAMALCPEASKALECLDVEKDIPVQCVSDIIVQQGAGLSYFPLLKLLDGSSPNANHYAIVELVKQGQLDSIITTNFDTLFETAFKKEAVPLTVLFDDDDYAIAPFSNVCKLLKIHGTVTDEATLIDTVTQKSRGLSPKKRIALETLLSGADIIVMGFSGADLDFDPEYIPFQSALLTGGSVTWLCRPNSQLHPAVSSLHKTWGDRFNTIEKDLSSFFNENGIDYNGIHEKAVRNAGTELCANSSWDNTRNEIHNIFSQAHLGPHACIGYCLTMLSMTGHHAQAKELASIYESKLDVNNLDLLCTSGLHQLVIQRMREGDFLNATIWASAEITCLEKTHSVLRKSVRNADAKVEDDYYLEYCSNMASAYLNRGLCAEHSEDISTFRCDIDIAEKYAEKSMNSRIRGLVAFAKARVHFAESKNEDAYIDGLKESRPIIESSGNLRGLAEVLLAECQVHLDLGEYAIADRLLEDCARTLKNVGDLRLELNQMLLRINLFIRKNQEHEALSLMKSLITLTEKKCSDRWAYDAMQILLEGFRCTEEVIGLIERLAAVMRIDSVEVIESYRSANERWWGTGNSIPVWIAKRLPEDKKRAELVCDEYALLGTSSATVLHQLCIRYVAQGKWTRLLDLAECYQQAASTPDAKVKAYYYTGCANLELGQYGLATEAFEAALDLSSSADPVFIGWTHIELSKIYLMQGKDDAADEQYREALSICPNQSSSDDLVNMCMNYVLELRRLRRWDDAKNKLGELLQVCPRAEKEMKSVIETINEEQRLYESRGGIKTGDLTPEEIATYALSLYEETGDASEACSLLIESKCGYEQRGSAAGVAKCENNLGTICVHERKYEEAKEHFMESIRINDEIGYTQGVMEQLANVINLHLYGVRVDNQVAYAEHNLPSYQSYPEKTLLELSLFYYYLSKEKLLEAYAHAKQVLEHRDHLVSFSKNYVSTANEASNSVELVKQFVSSMQSVIEATSNATSNDKFSSTLEVATRLYKAGQFNEAFELLDMLEKDACNDAIRLGRVNGTRGYAYLEEGKCSNAVREFRKAISDFGEADERDAVIESYKLNAYNGLTLALDSSGHSEEALDILNTLLSSHSINHSMFPLVINYINRTMQKYQKQNCDCLPFNELIGLLNQLSGIENLNEEEHGTLFHAYGSLYITVGELEESKKNYEKARHAFMVSNSRNLKLTELMIEEVNRRLNEAAE